MKKTGAVAIIGAGLSGLSCAQALQAAGVPVRVFEKGPSVGGRCATQLWQGHLVDLGVQYFTAQTAEFKKELLTRLRQFRPIVSPLMNQHDQIVADTHGPRFYVLQGNNYFAHVLSHGLEIRLNREIDEVRAHSSGGIECGGELYRAVVSALPGPLTRRLFSLNQTPAEYEPCLVGLFEYAGAEPGRTRDCYGRVTDGKDVIRASYCENNKVGRIVGNKTVFVVEAGADFSREYAESPGEVFLPLMIQRHEEMWGIPEGQLTAAYGHCWPYAWSMHETAHAVPLPPGAFLCGDSRSESTVEQVWLDGAKVAKEVVAYLNAHSA